MADPNTFPCTELQVAKCAMALALATNAECSTSLVRFSTKDGQSETHDFSKYFKSVQEFIAFVDNHCDGNTERLAGGASFVSRRPKLSQTRIVTTGL